MGIHMNADLAIAVRNGATTLGTAGLLHDATAEDAAIFRERVGMRWGLLTTSVDYHGPSGTTFEAALREFAVSVQLMTIADLVAAGRLKSTTE